MGFPIIIYSQQNGIQYISHYVDLHKHAPYTILGTSQTPETWHLTMIVAKEIEKAQAKLPWYKRLWPNF